MFRCHTSLQNLCSVRVIILYEVHSLLSTHVILNCVNLGIDFSQDNLNCIFSECHACHLVVAKMVVLEWSQG